MLGKSVKYGKISYTRKPYGHDSQKTAFSDVSYGNTVFRSWQRCGYVWRQSQSTTPTEKDITFPRINFEFPKAYQVFQNFISCRRIQLEIQLHWLDASVLVLCTLPFVKYMTKFLLVSPRAGTPIKRLQQLTTIYVAYRGSEFLNEKIMEAKLSRLQTENLVSKHSTFTQTFTNSLENDQSYHYVKSFM